MGNKNTIEISNDELLTYKLGSVFEENPFDGKELDLYYQPGKAFFLIKPGEIALSDSKNMSKKCETIINCESVFGVSFYEDYMLNEIGSTYRISVMSYNSKSEKYETFKYYFSKEEDYRKSEMKLNKYNYAYRGATERNICVFVNPISGKKVSRQYFSNILKPVLDFNSIRYEMYETQSATYIDEFISDLDLKKYPFNEFVVIGGDGVYSQLINSIMKLPEAQQIIKFPVGLMPGGSTNSLCCAISGKDPVIAAQNIVRGSLLNGDIFRVNMQDTGECLYSSALTYGLPSDLVRESEHLRDLFGRYRYIATAIPKFINPKKFPVYGSEIFYKMEEPGSELDSTNFSSDEGEDQICGINIPKVNYYKTKNNCKVPTGTTEWKKINIEDFLFHVIITHENRSSVGSDVNAPFARIDDGYMYLFGVKKCSRFQALNFLSKVSKGTQVEYEKYFHQKATELRFKNPEGSFFCSDGEPYQSSDYTVKLLPGFVNLMGTLVKE